MMLGLTEEERRSATARPSKPDPFCISFLKSLSLLFALPILYIAIRYKFRLSQLEWAGSSGNFYYEQGRIVTECYVEEWNAPGVSERGEWTFIEKDIKCCHPSNFILTIDDKFYEDTYYLSGENWSGDFCPPDLKENNQLPITFDLNLQSPVRFKASQYGLAYAYVDASNAWWKCTKEGPKLFYELKFYWEGKGQCSATIMKPAAPPILYNQTSQILTFLMIAIFAFSLVYRICAICWPKEVVDGVLDGNNYEIHKPQL